MPPAPAHLPIEVVEKLLSAAEARQVPRAALLASAGIARLESEIALSSVCAIYQQAARLTGDDSFGLHVGEATAPRMYGPLGYIVANSASLGEALTSLAEYQPLWTSAAGVEIRRRGKTIRLRYWHEGAIPPEQRRQESEQMLATLLTFLREAAATRLNPIEVRFEHRAPAGLAEHRRIFGARLVFAAPATEIVFAASTLALPIPRADATLAELMRTQARSVLSEQKQREPLLDHLQDRLRKAMLDGGPISLSALARTMAIGPRTLQRLLRRRGVNFRWVAEEMRMAMAKDLLAEPGMAIAEIAFRLGFSQASAFHRAFRRSTGTTPDGFRRALRAREQHFHHD